MGGIGNFDAATGVSGSSTSRFSLICCRCCATVNLCTRGSASSATDGDPPASGDPLLELVTCRAVPGESMRLLRGVDRGVDCGVFLPNMPISTRRSSLTRSHLDRLRSSRPGGGDAGSTARALGGLLHHF